MRRGPVEATGRVSVSTGGVEGDRASSTESRAPFSSDGRFAVFSSAAANLIDGDTNGKERYLPQRSHEQRDQTGQRFSLGGQPTGDSDYPRSAATGAMWRSARSRPTSSAGTATARRTCSSAIWSATNDQGERFRCRSTGKRRQLSAGDQREWTVCRVRFERFQPRQRRQQRLHDIFVRDMQSNTTTKISSRSSTLGSVWDHAYPTISGDGRFIAYSASTRFSLGVEQGGSVILYDRTTGTSSTVAARHPISITTIPRSASTGVISRTRGSIGLLPSLSTTTRERPIRTTSPPGPPTP